MPLRRGTRVDSGVTDDRVGSNAGHELLDGGAHLRVELRALSGAEDGVEVDAVRGELGSAQPAKNNNSLQHAARQKSRASG